MTKCLQCKKEFNLKYKSQKYCSIKCRLKFNKEKYNNSVKGINKIKDYTKDYYINNAERLKQKRQKYYYSHLEQERKSRMNYYYNNLDKELSETNKLKRKLYKQKYREKPENKIKLNNYEYNRKKSDLAYRLKNTLRRRLLHAYEKYPHGKIKSSDEYGINYKSIIEHLIKNLPEDFNKNKYHIDHIIPLARFDFNNPDDIKKAFEPNNHQWLTALENQKKWCN